MAHECPECGLMCHCGEDADDLPDRCVHCDDYDDLYDYEETDSEDVKSD